MRFFLAGISAAVFASITVASGDAPEKSRSDPLEGFWRSTSLEHQGTRTELDGRMRVRGEVGICDELPSHSSIRFAKSTDGHLTIDIGQNRLKVQGRYEVKGNELRIAFDFNEPAKQPKSLRSEPGSNVMVMTFVRQTPDEAVIEALTYVLVDNAFGLADHAERLLTMEKRADERVGKIYIVGNDNVPDKTIRRCLEVYPGQRIWLWRLYLAEIRLACLEGLKERVFTAKMASSDLFLLESLRTIRGESS